MTTEDSGLLHQAPTSPPTPTPTPAVSNTWESEIKCKETTCFENRISFSLQVLQVLFLSWRKFQTLFVSCCRREHARSSTKDDSLLSSNEASAICCVYWHIMPDFVVAPESRYSLRHESTALAERKTANNEVAWILAAGHDAQ